MWYTYSGGKYFWVLILLCVCNNLKDIFKYRVLPSFLYTFGNSVSTLSILIVTEIFPVYAASYVDCFFMKLQDKRTHQALKHALDTSIKDNEWRWRIKTIPHPDLLQTNRRFFSPCNREKPRGAFHSRRVFATQKHFVISEERPDSLAPTNPW